MTKRLSIYMAGIMAACLMIAVPAAMAQGVIDPSVCSGVTDSSLCEDNENSKNDNQGSNAVFGQNGILTKAARIIAIIVGVAAVIMIIVGGLQYVLGSGDPTNITNAKNTILYAIIGVVVALLAQGIIVFVLERL